MLRALKKRATQVSLEQEDAAGAFVNDTISREQEGAEQNRTEADGAIKLKLAMEAAEQNGADIKEVFANEVEQQEAAGSVSPAAESIKRSAMKQEQQTDARRVCNIEFDDETEEQQRKLRKTEEEILTLRRVLTVKVRPAAGLERRCSITQGRKFSEDAMRNPYMVLSSLRKKTPRVEQLPEQTGVLEAAVKEAGGKKAWKKLSAIQQWRIERLIKQAAAGQNHTEVDGAIVLNLEMEAAEQNGADIEEDFAKHVVKQQAAEM